MGYVNPEYEQAQRERWSRIKRERWAVYGRHNDSRSDEDIVSNRYHFEVWTWDMCHYPDGRLKFNTSWLGRWRDPVTPEAMPWIFSDEELAERAATPA